MNSSTGFKKRSLLRPPSGMLSNIRQFLKVVDINQSEPIIASTIRTEVAVIQQQINILDKDKAIRTGQSSLEKTHILNLKKWLRDCQSISQKQDDDGKILKQMGVDSYEAGFRKLWKIASNLDLIISKMTELQIVQFIKYDQMFQAVSEHSSNGQRILQTISKGGFNPSSFQLSQLAVQRQIQLFQVINDIKRSNLNSGNLNNSKGISKMKDNTSQLIQQLREENRKLNDVLNQIQNQKKVQKSKPEPVAKQKTEPVKHYGSSKDVFIELEDKYKQEIFELNSRVKQLNGQLTQVRVQSSSYQARLKAAEDQLKASQFSLAKKPAAGTYQQALLQQMDKMKKGFQKKIQKILEEYSNKERQMRKKQYEYKTQNEKVKWQKGLLLKKFQALSA